MTRYVSSQISFSTAVFFAGCGNHDHIGYQVRVPEQLSTPSPESSTTVPVATDALSTISVSESPSLSTDGFDLTSRSHEYGFPPDESDSARSGASAASSVRSDVSSISSMLRRTREEELVDELPSGFIQPFIAPGAPPDRGTGRTASVDFTKARMSAETLSRLTRLNPRQRCFVQEHVQLNGVNGYYILSLQSSSPLGDIWKGNSGSHKITVKVSSLSDHVLRDFAVLKTLQGSGAVPALLPVAVPAECEGRIYASTYHGYHRLGDLWRGLAVNTRDLTVIAARGIELLRKVHDSGIIHGNVGFQSIAYRRSSSAEEVAESMRFVDFEFSKLWVDINDKKALRDGQPDDPQLPITSWSAFKAWGDEQSRLSPRGVRDDLLGLMECLVQLGTNGPLQFEGLSTGLEVAQRKHQLALQEAVRLRGPLYTVFQRIYGLAIGQTPQYGEYVALLRGE